MSGHEQEGTTGPVTCQPDEFRDVAGRFATGVTVITTTHDGRDHGMTASAVCSLSLEPPTIVACVNRRVPTGSAVLESKRFAVNILGEDQVGLAAKFATPHRDKFTGVGVTRGASGVPLLTDAIAHIECRVSEVVPATTHRIYIGAVTAVASRDGSPLAYFRGQFGRLQLSRDDPCYVEVRQRLLDAGPDAGMSLTAAELAGDLRLSEPEVERALAQLAADGIVSRHGQQYEVVPLRRATIEGALDARLAIELGAAALGVGAASPDALAELRRRMIETRRLIDSNRFVDVSRYELANRRFHEFLVGMAGSRELVDAYRRLSLPGVLVRGLQPDDEVSSGLVDDHERIVEAFEGGDLDRAQAAIVQHTRRTKETHRRALRDRPPTPARRAATTK